MSNLFLTIWFRPRATLRHVIDTNTSRHVIPLAMLMGVTNVLDRATKRRLGNDADFYLILVLSLLVGPIAGIFSLYVSGALLRWSGNLHGHSIISRMDVTANANSINPINR